MGNRQTNLDEYTFAVDVASGELTQKQIAKKHNISEVHVGEIVRGKSRPHVAEIITELAESSKEHAKARLSLLQDKAVGTVAEAMDGRKPPVALAAAKEVLNRTLGDPSKPELNMNQQQSNQPDDYETYLGWKAEKEGGPK